jgi:hypothetical protein
LAATNQVDDEAFEGDDDDDLEAAATAPPVIGFALHLGSMRLADSRSLADFGRGAGLGELGKFASLVEPTVTLTFERLVVPFRVRFASVSSYAGLDVDSLGGGVGAGYLVLRRSDIVLFPSLTLGVVRTRMLAGSSRTPNAPVTFDSLATAGGPAALSTVTVTADAAFDAQLRLVGTDAAPRGLYLGLRAGVTAPLGQSDWVLESDLSGTPSSPGPSAAVAGPFASISVSARF